ncbi:hypothetical protein PROFUN_09623 [Planoprotostelium fungivorum]|uniref:Uncharacterized protein n=1 Tax=Planoprotostelium fungivorum TaxID=1890364 RepID=A0A2P6MNV3_9EUKA|nr:hypothetical protein PROFUN_09623 [Planoprotostelium fungivorum]
MAWKAVITALRIGVNTVSQAYEQALLRNSAHIPPPKTTIEIEHMARSGAKSTGWVPVPIGQRPMSAEEAKDILGFDGKESIDAGWEKFNRLYHNNAPVNGGSTYMQAKIYTAYVTMGPNLGKKPAPNSSTDPTKPYWKTRVNENKT